MQTNRRGDNLALFNVYTDIIINEYDKYHLSNLPTIVLKYGYNKCMYDNKDIKGVLVSFRNLKHHQVELKV